ncbi:MAG: Twin-arginine translocation protein TatC [Brockia lithotrophica]|uniref:Sec-independent protein translocase protein TatC n=1 Tax=Brockia lithotrophica TaxID=933949 RepID=A0A2T5G4M2_9BACL|nr:MAG: Twin-arginine translocation protein TatC [Brockia lithotrophica]
MRKREDPYGPEKRMTITEHLGELRQRLIRILFFFLFSGVLGIFLSSKILPLLNPVGIPWYAFAPSDAITLYLKVGIYFALFVTIPYALWEIYLFVRPGLTEEEAKIAIRYIPLTVLAFLVGILFTYAVLFPVLFDVLTWFNNQLDLPLLLSANAYISFFFRLALPVSLIFEVPVIVLFFGQIGVFDHASLVRLRPYVYFAGALLVVFGFRGDLLSSFFALLPFFFLFELSVFVAWLAEKLHLYRGKSPPPSAGGGSSAAPEATETPPRFEGSGGQGEAGGVYEGNPPFPSAAEVVSDPPLRP